MMGSTTLTTNLETDLTTFRQLLLAGDLKGAWHVLQVLSDEGANDATFYLAKGIVTLFKGDEPAAEKLFQRAEGIEGDTPSISYDELYGQLLIEGAVCKLLIRDTRADLVKAALETAEPLLAGVGQRKQAEATMYIEILDHVAHNKIDQALSLHRRMTDAWTDSNDVAIQSWKNVLDMAILQSLCERTRPADRLFTITRGRPKKREAKRYENAILCIDILDSILESNMPKRSKLTAVRIFIFGRVGARR